jgi:hypothetical protein
MTGESSNIQKRVAALQKAKHDVNSAGKGYGQNLYYGGGAGYDSPGDAISSWYNYEIENYDTYGDAALVDTAAGVYQPQTS